MSSSLPIPDIDITPLLNDSSTLTQRQQVAHQLLNAFTTYGVFYIHSPNHPAFQSEKILNAAKRLFALDDTHKDQIPRIHPGGFTRGYIPVGGESGSKTKENKEAFSYGYEWSSAELEKTKQQQHGQLNGLQGDNSWPAQETLDLLDKDLGGKDEFKKTLTDFYMGICQVARGLMKGISLALELPDEDELAKYCTTSDTVSFMRLFHYLPYADQQHTSQIGSSAHTDWGFLTLILSPSNTVGLQLFYEKAWHDVPSRDNTLVINVGDHLSLLTRGKLVSPLHRVVSNGQEERYSMCCFYYPDYDSTIPLLVQGNEQVQGQALSGSYSLLSDQRSEEDQAAAAAAAQPGDKPVDTRSTAEKLVSGDINFGDYIVGKWAQVYRKGSY
ncbi:hypothetical protein BGX31_007672 [Mortierella sp. GBA43]|nr:hypothetical protein BGX31_007672 [Mortierella sp. GBA43]